MSKSYMDGMACYGRLKDEGEAVALTPSEFADVYRKGRPYRRPERTLGQEMLYRSKRQFLC